MLIIGLYMVLVSTLVAFHVETAPELLVFIANIVFFTGWILCTISWCSLTEKLKRIEKAEKELDKNRKEDEEK